MTEFNTVGMNEASADELEQTEGGNVAMVVTDLMVRNAVRQVEQTIATIFNTGNIGSAARGLANAAGRLQ